MKKMKKKKRGKKMKKKAFSQLLLMRAHETSINHYFDLHQHNTGDSAIGLGQCFSNGAPWKVARCAPR